jgi:hypothetical protein
MSHVYGISALSLVCEGFIACYAASQGTRVSYVQDELRPTHIDQLCVTEGRIQSLPDGMLRIEDSKVRAVIRYMTEQEISLRFRYHGATSKQSPLRSGEMRQQFGLKLLAADGCNVLYAMWRLEPESKLVVQLKRNPGKTKSSECGNSGYETLKPFASSDVPVLAPNSEHLLTARLNKGTLVVFVDQTPVWQGNINSDLLTFSGPVGLRTDNVTLDFNLFTGPAGQELSCRPTRE